MLLDRFGLDGKVAIVTGAGRGIGAAIAKALGEAGAGVTLVARTEADLEKTAANIDQALVLPGDVNDEEVLASAVERTVERFGRIDVVVNNAGGTPPKAFLDTSSRMMERAFHFNVTTAFVLSKLATPHLLQSGQGSIVNISSAVGRLADRGFVAYSTAKAALSHMTRVMAVDLAPKVRVNAIAVGSVRTDALETVLDDDLRDEMIRRTPLHRLGEVEDIAIAALYLASPASSFVTGKVMEVDGGIEAPNLGLGLEDL